MERETGIEPATNGLGSRYSTIELLPLKHPCNEGNCNIGRNRSESCNLHPHRHTGPPGLRCWRSRVSIR